MTVTIGIWVLTAFVALGGFVGSYFLAQYHNSTKVGIVFAIITVIICAGILLGASWYYNNTGSGARAWKDYQSNMHNGIERSLQIIADDGMVIYEREGKFDIEVHDDYIVFDENGERTILYRSYTSTLVIEETGN